MVLVDRGDYISGGRLTDYQRDELLKKYNTVSVEESENKTQGKEEVANSPLVYRLVSKLRRISSRKQMWQQE